MSQEEMNEMAKSLVKVSTFSKMSDYSIKHIYRLINEKKINSIEIDGVKFVNIKNLPEEYKKKST